MRVFRFSLLSLLSLCGLGLAHSASKTIVTDIIYESTTICPETETHSGSVGAQSTSATAVTSTVWSTNVMTQTQTQTETVTVSVTVCPIITTPRTTSSPPASFISGISSSSAPNTVLVSSIVSAERVATSSRTPTSTGYTPTYRAVKTTSAVSPTFTGGASPMGRATAEMLVSFAAAAVAAVAMV